MSTATERIPVLVTKTQKQRLMARAKAAGLSTGEFLRRAAESYSPSEDEVLLEGLLKQREWDGWDSSCRSCYRRDEHAPDCELAKALHPAPAEGEKP